MFLCQHGNSRRLPWSLWRLILALPGMTWFVPWKSAMANFQVNLRTVQIFFTPAQLHVWQSIMLLCCVVLPRGPMLASIHSQSSTQLKEVMTLWATIPRREVYILPGASLSIWIVLPLSPHATLIIAKRRLFSSPRWMAYFFQTGPGIIERLSNE